MPFDYNNFLGQKTPTMPTLPDDGLCASLVSPLLSQVKAVLILPIGGALPTTTTTSTDIEAVIDNSITGNSVGKWIVGWGEVLDPEDVTVTLGRVKKVHCRNNYSLLLNVLVHDQNYSFLNSLQSNWTGFRFWFYTIGGRFIGGSNGIKPNYVRPTFSYRGGQNDIESGKLLIEWSADADPQRSYVPGIFGVDNESVNTNFEVAVNRQSYNSQPSSQLLWTENAGSIDAPFANNLWVFMNGQKLLPDSGQYTITPNSGPSQSTITIDSNVHYSGANYEIFTFTPAS